MKTSSIASVFINLFLCIACGYGGGSGGNGTPFYGNVEKAFCKASQQSHIPYQILLAVAAKESGISGDPTSAICNTDKDLGLSVGETAFGLTYAELGIDATPENQNLPEQVKAYTVWIHAKLTEKIWILASPSQM